MSDLENALLARNLTEVRNLVNNGADVNEENGVFAPLHWAVIAGIDFVRTLVENGAKINEFSSVDFNLPINDAIRRGNIEIVRYLISHGADVNIQDNKGMTPLHYAVRNRGDIEIVKLLVQHGASWSIRNDKGTSAIKLARKYGRTDIIEYFNELTQGNNGFGKTIDSDIRYLKSIK